MKSPFIHLSLHTEFSLVDGVVRIKPLMKAAAAAGMPAVALTDQGNWFALVRFYKAAQAAGVKPILGVDVLVREQASEEPTRLLLLCQNAEGYRNLTELVSRSYLENQQAGRVFINKEWLNTYNSGLIALSGGREGDVGRAILNNKPELARERLHHWLGIFPGRFYLELQRTGREYEDVYNTLAVSLAEELYVPVVATNDVRFLQKDDFEAHEVRVCINDGRTLDDPRRPKRYSDQQYLRSSEEMYALFADIPEAIENTWEIAKRCNVTLRLGESFLPNFPVPAGDTIDSYFATQSQIGLAQRLAQLQKKGIWNDERLAIYQARLEREIGVIIQMGFPSYFLIVADFIQWAKHNDVPVGPGRGSGAGSLVAYALGITDLDPLQYDLLFERFLNPERVSLPDFDVDFCMEGRDRVIDYVAQKYGRDKVSQIITFGTMAAKAVVRDVGRVLGYPYGFVDNIAKLIPFEIGMTLEKAMEDSDDLRKLYETEEDVRELLDTARSLEGLVRNAGKHAGGVVIAPSKLTDFTPLYCEADGQSLVTQLDKDDVESIGLVKFDFLGLRTLTIIDWAVKAINRELAQAGQAIIDITQIPLEDSATFELLKRQSTTAVFQLESRGMKDLIGRLQPDIFEEIIALVALFRPGPLQSGMVDDFVDCKHGRAKSNYPHPLLEPILRPTYGVILYQEQVMQIAQILSGYSLGDADLLRRAMGKKKPEEMAQQREMFLNGARANNVNEQTANYIFDLMEKFAGYGFNKSHSAAYALVSYQTAWLKAHYPAEFMASVLSADMDNTDKVVRLIDECQQMKLKVVPPDINRSYYRFTTDKDNQIIYGLGAIKGLGEGATDNIVYEREQRGVFNDLYDFCARIDTQKLNKRSFEALIKGGALDSLGKSRASLMLNLPHALKLAEQDQRNQDTGQTDIFGEMLAPQAAARKLEWQVADEWEELQRLAAEKEVLGLYLTGHPIEQYQAELKHIAGKRIREHIESLESRMSYGERSFNSADVVIAGLVTAIRAKNTRSGKMGFLTIDDRSDRVEAVISADDFQRYANVIVKDKVLVIEGALSPDDFNGGFRVRVRKLYDMDSARETLVKAITLTIDETKGGNGFIRELNEALQPFRVTPAAATTGVKPGQRVAGCLVWIEYRNARASGRLVLDEQWRVQPREQLVMRLKQWLGDEYVQLVY
ncbi:MAG: DNA polymerase III subunit alpha [Gammaproteobacteria bacterium]|nr:DNA polymerase III subunit alpha [Gammaproteobacteria bacterium]